MIIGEGGVSLFNLIESEKNPLYNAFLSAIQSFSLELAPGGINNLELYDTKLFIEKSNNGLNLRYTLIVKNDKSRKNDKKALKTLNKIIEVFESEYKKVIPDSCGEISLFDSFKDYFIKNPSSDHYYFDLDKSNRPIKNMVNIFHKPFL
jgi:hypothetical protein